MERLLTPRDLADMTGLAVQTIYNRHSNGSSLPACLMLGRLLRFRQQDVDAWLDQHYQNTDHPALPKTANSSRTAGKVARAK